MQEMQRQTDRRQGWGSWEYQHFPQRYYKVMRKNYTGLNYTNTILTHHRPTNELPWILPFLKMSTSTSQFVNSELSEYFHVWGCEWHKMMSFIWMILMDTVNTRPFAYSHPRAVSLSEKHLECVWMFSLESTCSHLPSPIILGRALGEVSYRCAWLF